MRGLYEKRSENSPWVALRRDRHYISSFPRKRESSVFRPPLRGGILVAAGYAATYSLRDSKEMMWTKNAL